MKVKGKNVYFFTLTKVNSCQKSFELLPVFSNQALINQTSFISDISYELNKKSNLIMSYGIERVKGNILTDLGENGMPRNQKNSLFGCGFDYKIGEKAMIFLRQNFYRFYDPNFFFKSPTGNRNYARIKK